MSFTDAQQMSVAFPNADDIKMIVSDVDGTLLDSDHRLHPRTYHALKWLRENRPNLPIVIATGKQRTSVQEIRTPLSLDLFPALHLNGCVVYDPHGKVKVEVGLELDTLNQLYDQCKHASLSLFMYDREKVYEFPGKDGSIWADKLRGYGEDLHTVDEKFMEESVRTGHIKIVKAAICQVEGLDLEKTRDSLLHEYPSTAFSITQALPFCLELIPTTGSKGIALAKILGTEIESKNVMAFGDGENDVSMFKVAGYSVSMANAMVVARTNATFSTLSNDEGGVGAFIERVWGFTYSELPYDYWL